MGADSGEKRSALVGRILSGGVPSEGSHRTEFCCEVVEEGVGGAEARALALRLSSTPFLLASYQAIKRSTGSSLNHQVPAVPRPFSPSDLTGMVIVSGIVVVWFAIGGFRDIRAMLRRLAVMRRDDRDDGWVRDVEGD